MTEPTIRVQNFGGIGGATYEMMDNVSGADWKFKATNSGGFKIRDNTFSLDVMTFEPNSIANAIYINTAGNVGIRTTTPSANFHVAETAPSYTGQFGTSIAPWIQGTNVSIGDDNNDCVLYLGHGVGHEGFLIWQYDAVTPANSYYSVGTFDGAHDLVLQEVGGNVGIRTITPQALLDVNYDLNTFSRLGNSAVTSNSFYHLEDPANGDNQSAIYAFRTVNYPNENDGVGYFQGGTNQAIQGYNFWGDLYTFGIAGFNFNDYNRCGGIFGSDYSGTYWGSLGYKDSGGTGYGGYFTSWTTGGAGKSSQAASVGIGLGAWGDLLGADIHGKIYGIYAEGNSYAMFSNGDVYKNKLDVHLQDNGKGTNTVLYTNVSTQVTVQTYGTVALSNGMASIAFDPAFAAAVSAEEPVVVTVTPTGSSNGVFLSGVTSSGFTVVENNAGRSNVTVNYIAIDKRAGYENPSLPKEVIDAGYTSNMSRGLKPDADTRTNSEGLYYENGQLNIGIHPSTLPDPNKPAEMVENPPRKTVTQIGDSPVGREKQKNNPQ